jgi:TolB-like protein/Flp pilus assembly protein TadD
LTEQGFVFDHPAGNLGPGRRPATDDASLIHLGDCRFDPRGGTLRRGEDVIDLRAKSFTLLAHLARHAGRVLTKDDLITAVWPDVTVTEDSLTQAIRDIRVQLGPAGAACLRTVARRGYMLVPDAGPGPVSVPAPSRRDGRTRVAVVPFEDATGAAGEAARIAMLNEEIAAGLARFRTIVVLGPRAAASADDSAGPQAVAARLAADYLIAGTARHAPGGFALSLTLMDAYGALIWSEVFDCGGAAILGQSDGISRRVVERMSASLETNERDRAAYRPTESLTAFDHFARGVALIRRADPGFYADARVQFEKAVAADPNFGLAHAHLGWAELCEHGFGLAPESVKRRAVEHAQRGVDVSPGESRAIGLLGYVLAFVGAFEASEQTINRALALNPFSDDTMRDKAVILLGRGRGAEALDWIERAADVLPVGLGHDDILRFEACFLVRDYDGAAQAAARVAHPDLRQRTFMAGIAALRGRRDEALRHLADVAAIDPDWDHVARAHEGYLYERAEDTEHLLGAIRLALALRDRAPQDIGTAAD